jgi:16S rRNA (guanine527-N7)-methyltransferase
MGVSRETLIERYFPLRRAEISAYAALLSGTGIERGLIGPREGERIWERHIFNCIAVTTLIPEGSRVFDVGSGAGLPGIVIALARPDLQVTLVEPLQRRVDFLIEATEGLEIEVLRARAQEVKGQAPIVVARALAPMDRMKRMLWHLVEPGGSSLP